MLYSTRLSKKSSSFEKLTVDSILKRLETFSNVFIISAYYSNETINKFLNFKGIKKIEMVFSAVSGSKEKKEIQLHDLKNEFKSLKGKRNKKILLCNKWPILHSKIYLGINIRIDGATCFVGSSNLSNNGFRNNEEVLIEVLDTTTKNEIREYINLIRTNDYSFNIFCKNPYKDIIPTETNLQSYISNGYIVYKPDIKMQLNFSNDELREFAKNINKNTKLENADLESTISIKIAEIAGIKKELDTLDKSLKSSEEDEGTPTIRANSIETCLGYWMPEIERIKMKPYLEKKRKKREVVYKTIVNRLENIANSNLSIDDGLKKFVNSFIRNNNSMNDDGDIFFNKLKKEVINHIIKKLKGMQRDRDRYIEGLYITPMPDIWDDTVTSKLFMDSFVSDIDFKISNKRIRGVKLAKKIYGNYGESLQKIA